MERYRARLSGPMADRFDLRVPCHSVSKEALLTAGTGERTEAVRRRVEQAKQLQLARQQVAGVSSNAELQGEALEGVCRLSKDAVPLASKMLSRGVSPRGFHRILRVGRTIADLAGETHVLKTHIAEAYSLRSEI